MKLELEHSLALIKSNNPWVSRLVLVSAISTNYTNLHELEAYIKCNKYM